MIKHFNHKLIKLYNKPSHTIFLINRNKSNMAATFLPEQLLTKEGLKPRDEVLKGKTKLGIYFSAHWCPPCRGFTPVLAEMYNELKEVTDKVEIVFCSSDNDQSSFDDYYGSQPWVSIPYGDDFVGKLGEIFQVRGIPTLVVVDVETGKTIDKDGRSTVASAKGNISKVLGAWGVSA